MQRSATPRLADAAGSGGDVPRVCVHGPLRKLAGGSGEHRVGGETVTALLRALEHEHPDLAGWILDERGRLRRHVNVYVNGELVGPDSTVAASDRVEVLPAISGGAKAS